MLCVTRYVLEACNLRGKLFYTLPTSATALAGAFQWESYLNFICVIETLGDVSTLSLILFEPLVLGLDGGGVCFVYAEFGWLAGGSGTEASARAHFMDHVEYICWSLCVGLMVS